MSGSAGANRVARRVWTWLVPGLVAGVGLPATVSAHTGGVPTPGSLWTAWNWDPLLIPLLFGLAAGYWRGTSRIWSRIGRGQGVRGSHVLAFIAAMIVLVVAVISPLDALGEALFSAHMVQHLLLILVVAPLMVFARPWLPVLWSLPGNWRVSAGRLLRPGTTIGRALSILATPIAAWVLHLIAIWIWHIPLFYEAAIHSWSIHLVEHVTFLATAMLFWWSVLPLGRRAEASRGGLAILSLFTTALHSGLLSAIITFSGVAWYASHAGTTQPWGLTPIEDQQLAGVIMWVPMGVVYTISAAGILILLLQRLDQDDADDWSSGERAAEVS